MAETAVDQAVGLLTWKTTELLPATRAAEAPNALELVRRARMLDTGTHSRPWKASSRPPICTKSDQKSCRSRVVKQAHACRLVACPTPHGVRARAAQHEYLNSHRHKRQLP